MRKTVKRTFRSFLAYLLTVCMVLSMGVPVFAAGTESDNVVNGKVVYNNGVYKVTTTTYVSIGDSMSNGYCFDGYHQGEETDDEYNFLEGIGGYGIDAYPDQFAEWLEENTNSNVNHIKLAPSAMRAEDLLYLLGGREKPQDDWQNQVNGYTDVDDEALKEFYQNAVIDADIITLGIGNASFGAYMLHRVTDALGVFGAGLDEDERIDDDELQSALIGLDEEQKELVMQIYANLKADMYQYIPADMAEMFNVDDICNIITYTVVGFVMNYKGCVERIIELNPDVEIVLVGLLNTTYGMNVTDEGFSVPIGDIMDTVFSVLNSYVAGLPTVLQAVGELEEAVFYYAEQPEPKFICQQFAALKDAKWRTVDKGRLSGEIVRNRNIGAYNNSLREMIAAAFSNDQFKLELPAITLNDVKTFEENPPSWSYPTYGYGFTGQGNDPKNLSVAIYLGIEDAVAESIDTMDIPVDGLLAIATDIGRVFTGLELDVTDADVTPTAARETLASYLISTETLKGMCKIYALFKVGNGMSVHPTPTGHDEIALAVIDAYKNGYTAADETVVNLKEAYKYAYEQAYANGYIAQAQGYIDVAIDAVETAKATVDEISVAPLLDAVKVQLLNELDEAVNTLVEFKEVLNNDNVDDTWAAILNLENNLIAHRDNIAALANELGIAADSCINDFADIANYCTDLVSRITTDAYEWLANSVEEFSEEYATWVESVGEIADKISPELGAAVREYLTETPAEALAVIYAAGDDAVSEFIAATAAASDDISLIITAIAAVLEADIKAVADAVYNSDKVQDIIVSIDDIKSEIRDVTNEFLTKPVSSLLAYKEILNNLKNQITIFQRELVEAILDAIDEEVDPALASMVRKAFNALEDAIDAAETSGDQYGKWFAGRFEQMAGDLLTLIIDNTVEFGVISGSIIDDLIRDFINDTKEEIKDKIDEVEDFIGSIEIAEIDLSEIYALIGELKVAANDINAVLTALKKYAGDDVAAIITELENALAQINDYADKLQAFAENIEELINKIGDETELTIEKIQAIVEQAKALAADADALVKDAKSSLAILGEIYEQLLPHIYALMEYVEEGSPVDVLLDSTDMEIGEFVETVISGYENTVNAIETAAANIDGIVIDTMDAVCCSIADAVEAMAEATDTAVTDITAIVTPAMESIKAEAEKLAMSTNAMIAEAGNRLYTLVEAVEMSYSEAELAAKQTEVKAIVDNIITTLENVETVEDAKDALAQTGDVLKALYAIAEDIYAIVKGDVMDLITTANTLAQQVAEIPAPVAESVYSNAEAAYHTSAVAIFNAADFAVQAIQAAVKDYEQAVADAAGVILTAVTDGAENIGSEVAVVVNTITNAAEAIAESAESGFGSIKSAAEYVPYDVTHGEYVVDSDSYYVALGAADYAAALAERLGLPDNYAQLDLSENYGEEVAKADLVTVTFDVDEFVALAYNQAMGMVMDVVGANEKLVGLLNGPFGSVIEGYLYNMGINTDAKVMPLDWSKFDAASLAAKDEILSIAEAVLHEQFVEPVVIFDLGAELEKHLGMDPDIKLEIPVAEMAMAAVENILYGYFEFAVEFPAVLNHIRAIAPEAQVVVTGLVNPEEAIQEMIPAELCLDLGAYTEYIGYAVDALNQHFFAYAAINANTTYVESIDAESIYDALNVTIDVGEYLLGDVDLDGDVDMDDFAALMRHVLKAEVIYDPTALAAAEVTGDSTLDMDDAAKIMMYVLKAIDSLE